MLEIKNAADLAAAREEPLLLLAYMQKGCVPCASVSPLLERVDRLESVVTARMENNGEKGAPELLDLEGSPTWIAFVGGEEKGRIHPNAKTAGELRLFFEENLGVSPEMDELEKALEEGREYAAYVDSCIAELAFRRSDTGEEMLLTSIRMKVYRACVECSEEGLRSCVAEEMERLGGRLRGQMEESGDGSGIRGKVLQQLPDLEKEIYRDMLQMNRASGRPVTG